MKKAISKQIMTRPTRRSLAIGIAVGALITAWYFQHEQSLLAQGENAAGVGFGLSIALFAVSLPWSLLVWLLLLTIGTITGADGPGFLRPFFYAMPVVAGAGWGALISIIAAERRKRRASRTPL